MKSDLRIHLWKKQLKRVFEHATGFLFYICIWHEAAKIRIQRIQRIWIDSGLYTSLKQPR